MGRALAARLCISFSLAGEALLGFFHVLDFLDEDRCHILEPTCCVSEKLDALAETWLLVHSIVFVLMTWLLKFDQPAAAARLAVTPAGDERGVKAGNPCDPPMAHPKARHRVP